MCGRFSLGIARPQVRSLLGHDIQIENWVDEASFVPRNNIAPRSYSPVLVQDNGFSESQKNPSKLILHTMKWGLVPSWSKHEGKNLNTINARAENLVEGGGMWGSIKGRKRCVVLCQGYYEWLKKGKDKLPYFTKLKDENGVRLMLLAGLYDCTYLEGSMEPLWTFTIVTTSACKEFEWLHDRQPVILSTREALNTWLDTSSQTWTATLAKLVQPYDCDSSGPLDCYQVPKEVGKVGTESPSFIEPIATRKDGIQAMFSRQKEAQSSPKRKRSLSSSPLPSAIKPSTPVQNAGIGKADCSSSQSTPSNRMDIQSPSKTKRRKTQVIDKDHSSAQITQFFSKR